MEPIGTGVERPAAQRRQAERRRLWDRRSPVRRRSVEERRTGERRNSVRQVVTERRVRPDRRGAARRHEPDRRSVAARRRGRRRRETPTPYTAAEFADLRARFAAPGSVSCPACGGQFTLSPARRRGAEIARRVLCLGCGRAAVVPHSCAARVLVVTHNPSLRNLLREMLAGAGHEVVETDDAGVALAAYQTVPSDLVMIDVLAPGRLSAPDFLRQLRRTFPDARVVALAGRPSFAGVDPLAVVQGLGAVRSMRAPIAREALLRIVEEARA
jgi:CheY-like chemotaxis protein